MIQQAGAIAVRMRDRLPEVLIVRARKNPQDWIFPKGHVESGETTRAAAERELLEEGGVIGRAADLVGISDISVSGRRLRVSYYLVWCEAEGVAKEQRERAWLAFPEARTRLSFADARDFLDIAERLVASA